MSEDFGFSSSMPSDEMAQYLQMYLDETTEQLDALVESLLVLESHPTNAEQLNEAFRLVHSIKGSSAMMGLNGATILTHLLESHFQRLRGGLRQLDPPTMGLILRSIDFLRVGSDRLRAGEPFGSSPELVTELNALLASPAPHAVDDESPPRVPAPDGLPPETTDSTPTLPSKTLPESHSAAAEGSAQPWNYRVAVDFEPELALPDLKAELVLTRLAGMGDIRSTRPPQSEFGSTDGLRGVQILLSSTASPAELRAAADVDGVQFIEVEPGATEFSTPAGPAAIGTATTEPAASVEAAEPVGADADVERSSQAVSDVSPAVAPDEAVELYADVQPLPPAAAAFTGKAEARSKVVETVRVDIERLDNLLNLAGELVVNKARFVQIARQMSPAFKKSGLTGRARAFSESMRRALQWMKTQAGNGQEQLRELEAEIDALEEQANLWEESRRSFAQITEAIDQMTRVSDSLQRGVLGTRMVPVAPLFNRFKRVVRDISLDLGKKVNLEIHGEKTELDKRMIDELGDPLVHLVRNAIDHGIEPAELRVRHGKPEIGTIRLEATHSGNNVLISVRDDGEGIHIEEVRQRLVDRGLVTADLAGGLSDREVIEYIWSPGFSTATVVSNVSGRGVGMDIVKTRISELNGTIEIDHAAGRGTCFTIRLPLTLAIIRSLLFRLRHGVFAVPIDNVREIVSVPVDQIVTVHGKQTFEVRGEFTPLVDIDDIFDWHMVPYRYPGDREFIEDADPRQVNVVILSSGDKTMGLKVNELQGGQDIVIKSLAENFIHIRGLSGASILGDGSVCLLFDVGTAIAIASDPRRRAGARRQTLGG